MTKYFKLSAHFSSVCFLNITNPKCQTLQWGNIFIGHVLISGLKCDWKLAELL